MINQISFDFKIAFKNIELQTLVFKINKKGLLWGWMTFRLKSFESQDCFVRTDV